MDRRPSNPVQQKRTLGTAISAALCAMLLLQIMPSQAPATPVLLNSRQAAMGHGIQATTSHWHALAPTRDVTVEVDYAMVLWGTELYNARSFTKTIPLSASGLAAESDYSRFFNLVKHGGSWDIKTPMSWAATIGTEFPGTDTFILYFGKVMTTEKLCSYTYGYLGAAYGVPLPVLLYSSFCAELPQDGGLNHATDKWELVRLGYDTWCEEN